MAAAISSVILLLPTAAERALAEHADLGPGIVVHACPGIAEFDRLQQRVQADVVLVDQRRTVGEPGGIDALQMARRRDPDCFRVLLGDPADPESMIRGFNLGVVDAILPRPLSEGPLRAIVNQGCEAALLRRHNRSLLGELGQRNHELLELNARLEELVRERTAELRRTMDDLQGANRELQAKQQELVRLETQGAIAQLVRGLAHELNNPLAVVIGYAQRLRRLITDADQARRMEVILAEAGRCSALVERLRSFAQPVDEQPQACSIAAAADRAARDLRNEGIEPPVIAAADGIPPVWAGQRGLVRALAAVLRNAAEAGAARIAISAERGLGHLLVHVDNDGETPSDEQCRNAMRPFFTTRSAAGRQGLGLALAAALLGEMGGRIELRSRPGGGARVAIALPEPPTRRRSRILIVDDEPLIRELVADSLADDGVEVVLAGSLAEADALAAAERPDAVIVDRHLGDGDGAAWAAGLHLPGRILLLSGDGAAQTAGMAVLGKPFAVDELRARVRSLLAGA
ncbi:MAG: Sensor protein ZraS [Planctomycetota bacterium]